jgi:hypothetical protein
MSKLSLTQQQLEELGLVEAQGIIRSFEIQMAIGSSADIPLPDFLLLVLETLGSHKCVLVGGLALSEYAKPRATQDLDFVIVPEDKQTVLKALEDKGFVIKQTLPYHAPDRDIIKLEFKGRECDFIIFKSKSFMESINKRARNAAILGEQVKIASVEDLVITKLASSRHKDIADIMSIRSKSDKLDLGYIRNSLWDLGISDRLPFLHLPIED